MTHYLITGGAGFIGSNLTHALVERGQRVSVIDNFITGRRENLHGVLDKIKLVEGSINDGETLRELLTDVDVVLHQAALPSVPKSLDRPLDAHHENLTGTLNLFEACRMTNTKRVVYASSSSAYGDHDAQVKIESLEGRPKSPYAVQKFGTELYAKVYHELFGLETVGLRYFNVFGPRQDPMSQYAAVVPAFVTRMLKEQSPIVFGTGEQSRDFTYISNVIEANLLAASAANIGGEVFNVGCGFSTSLLSLIESINEVLGTNIEPIFESARKGDVLHSLAGIDKAREHLGYQPSITVKAGLLKTIEWYRLNAKTGA
ncbi:MAG: SDR family oxidoreductase [Bradymonadia bacterium]